MLLFRIVHLQHFTLHGSVVRHASIGVKIADSYDNFIKKRIPAFYPTHRRIVDGGRGVVSDMRVYFEVWWKLLVAKRTFVDLSKHQLETFLLVPPEFPKLICIMLLIAAPLTIFILPITMVLMPRFLLTRHFWTDAQFQQFNEMALAARQRRYFPPFLLHTSPDLLRSKSSSDALGLLLREPKLFKDSMSDHLLPPLAGAHGMGIGIGSFFDDQLFAPLSQKLARRSHILHLLDEHMAQELDTKEPTMTLRDLQQQCYLRQLSVDGLGRQDVVDLLKAWCRLSSELNKTKNRLDTINRRILLSSVLSQLWKQKSTTLTA